MRSESEQINLIAIGLCAVGLACVAVVLLSCAATPPLETPGDGDDAAGPGDPGDGPGDGGGDGGGDGSPPTLGCDGSGAAAQPFGLHRHALAPGVIVPSHRTRAELDDAVRLAYSSWKSRHLEAGCAGGRYFVKIGNGDATVSEASGYGMIVTAFMAGYDPEARVVFDGLYRFVRARPSSGSPELMSWSVEHGCGASPAKNSATDGDLDIAYALLLADKQWGSNGAVDYRAEAVRLIEALRWNALDPAGRYVRLGDWTHPNDGFHFDATRTSDFMPGHFASFEAAVGGGVWAGLSESAFEMLARLQAHHAPSTGLVPDFVVHPASAPAPAPGHFLERAVDGAYSFNACRVPLRLGVYVLTSGDARARSAVQKLNQWVRDATGGNPSQIKSGYWLDGNVVGDAQFRSDAFVGPLGVGAMVDASNQAWLNAIWDLLASSGADGYYNESLKLLSMIAMSGNWWAPEDAPCER